MKFNKSWLTKHTGLLLFCLAFCCPSSGQDIDPSLIAAEKTRSSGNQSNRVVASWGKSLPAGEKLALELLGNYEIVADGEFFRLPKSSSEELRALKREIVRVGFRIQNLHKGRVPETIDIDLYNDMLIVPSEGISRYMKRWRVMEKLWAELEPVLQKREALVRSLEAGDVDWQEYEIETDRLDAIIGDAIDGEGLQDWAIARPTHGRTFYDLGGAIRPNKRYLLGLNRMPQGTNAYGLSAFGGSSRIYWGEMRDYVLSAPSLANNQPGAVEDPRTD